MEQQQNQQDVVQSNFVVKAPWQAPTLNAMPVPEFTAAADLGFVDGLLAS